MHCLFDFSSGEGEVVHKQKIESLQKLVGVGFRISNSVCIASELLNIV